MQIRHILRDKKSEIKTVSEKVIVGKNKFNGNFDTNKFLKEKIKKNKATRK